MPEELYHREWARRRIRHKVHLSLGGCLGPCALSNVALLLFEGRQIWFHSITGDAQVVRIFDYVEAMVRADRYLPPPPELQDQVFAVFDWPDPAADTTAAEADDWRDGGATRRLTAVCTLLRSAFAAIVWQITRRNAGLDLAQVSLDTTPRNSQVLKFL